MWRALVLLWSDVFEDFEKFSWKKNIKSSTNFVNLVTGDKMPRGKKQKSPEEEQELLEDLYTNRNFSGSTTHNL